MSPANNVFQADALCCIFPSLFLQVWSYVQWLPTFNNNCTSSSQDSFSKSCFTFFRKTRAPELKPPDLWIHHDQMELKGVSDKGRELLDTPVSPSNRGSRELGDLEEHVPLQHSTNSLDKRNFMSSYLSELKCIAYDVQLGIVRQDSRL